MVDNKIRGFSTENKKMFRQLLAWCWASSVKKTPMGDDRTAATIAMWMVADGLENDVMEAMEKLVYQTLRLNDTKPVAAQKNVPQVVTLPGNSTADPKPTDNKKDTVAQLNLIAKIIYGGRPGAKTLHRKGGSEKHGKFY